MPDQAELRVDVVTTGSDQLDKIVQSLANIEKSFISATPHLKRVEDGIHGAGDAAESEAEKIKHFGESIRQHIETPLGSASLSLGKFAETLGPVGVGVAATAAVFGTLGTVAFETMKKLGEMGTEINNVSLRTGLSTEEVGQFGFAAKAAGADIGSFESGMKMLSRALSDNSDEGKKARTQLQELGIASRDLYGNLRPTNEIFLDLGDALNKADGAFNRNAIALNVLGRAGIELVPTLLKLRENVDLAKKAGIGLGEEEVKQLEQYHESILLIESAWDKVLRKISEVAVAGFGAMLSNDQFFDKFEKFQREQAGMDDSSLDAKPKPIDMKALQKIAHETLPAQGSTFHIDTDLLGGTATPPPTQAQTLAKGGAIRLNFENGLPSLPVLDAIKTAAPSLTEAQAKLAAIDSQLEKIYERGRIANFGGPAATKVDIDDRKRLVTERKKVQEEVDSADPFTEAGLKKKMADTQTGLAKQFNLDTAEGDRLKATLEDVKQSIKTLDASAAAGTLNLRQVADHRGFVRQKKAIEDSIEAMNKAAEATKTLKRLLSETDTSGLTGGDKLQADRANRLGLLRDAGADPALIKQLGARDSGDVTALRDKETTAAFDRLQKIQASMELQHATETIRHSGRMAELEPNSEANAPDLGFANKIESARKLREFSATAADNQFARDDAAAKTQQQHDEAAQKRLESYWKTAQTFSKEFYNAQDEREEKRKEDAKHIAELNIVADRTIDNIHEQTDRGALIRQSSRAGQIAQLQIPLGSGFEGQEEAINEAFKIRLDLAQKIKDVDMDRALKESAADIANGKQRVDIERSKADLIKESQEAEMDREMKLLALARQKKEEGRALSGGFFDAITSKDPSTAIKDFFIGQVKSVGRSVFSNVTESATTPIAEIIDRLKAIGSADSHHAATTRDEGLRTLPLGAGSFARNVAIAGVPEIDDPFNPGSKSFERNVAMTGKPGIDTSLPTSPLQIATDGNTTATQANTAALLRMTDSLMGFRGVPGGTFASDALVSQAKLSDLPLASGALDRNVAMTGTPAIEAPIDAKHGVHENRYNTPVPEKAPYPQDQVKKYLKETESDTTPGSSAGKDNAKTPLEIETAGRTALDKNTAAVLRLTDLPLAQGSFDRNVAVTGKPAFDSTDSKPHDHAPLEIASTDRTETVAGRTATEANTAAITRIANLAGGVISAPSPSLSSLPLGAGSFERNVAITGKPAIDSVSRSGAGINDSAPAVPLTASTDANTAATDANTAALQQILQIAGDLGIGDGSTGITGIGTGNFGAGASLSELPLAAAALDRNVSMTGTPGITGTPGFSLSDLPLGAASFERNAALTGTPSQDYALSDLPLGAASFERNLAMTGTPASTPDYALSDLPLGPGAFDRNVAMTGTPGIESAASTSTIDPTTTAGGFTATVKAATDGLSKIGAAFGEGAGSVATGGALGNLIHGNAPTFNPADGSETPAGAAGTATQIGAGIGLAGAAYSGVTSAIHDFKKGGAQGITAGIGDVAQTAAAFDPEPISHAVLQGVALAAKVVSSIMGDPKAERESSIQHELTNSRFSSQGNIDARGNFVAGAQAASISYFGASGGASFDYDFRGGLRGGSAGSTSRNTFDPSAAANQPRDGFLAAPQGEPQGHAISTAQTQAPVIVQVQAMDSKSFLDHSADISDAVRKGVQQGHPLVAELAQTLNPR
jgi:hypothetical protein